MNTTLHIELTSDGVPALDSNEVSLLLEVPHNVLYAQISELRRELEAVKINPRTYFRIHTYGDNNGRFESYRMTWEGLILLSNSFPGEKGLIMRAASASTVMNHFKALAAKEAV